MVVVSGNVLNVTSGSTFPRMFIFERAKGDMIFECEEDPYPGSGAVLHNSPVLSGASMQLDVRDYTVGFLNRQRYWDMFGIPFKGGHLLQGRYEVKLLVSGDLETYKMQVEKTG